MITTQLTRLVHEDREPFRQRDTPRPAVLALA